MISEGRLVALTLTTSGLSLEVSPSLSHLCSLTTLQMPVGARFVGIPGTEWLKFVGFEMNDTLCISGHSDETRISPDIEPIIPCLPLTTLRALSGQGVVLGVVTPC